MRMLFACSAVSRVRCVLYSGVSVSYASRLYRAATTVTGVLALGHLNSCAEISRRHRAACSRSSCARHLLSLCGLAASRRRSRLHRRRRAACLREEARGDVGVVPPSTPSVGNGALTTWRWNWSKKRWQVSVRPTTSPNSTSAGPSGQSDRSEQHFCTYVAVVPWR